MKLGGIGSQRNKLAEEAMKSYIEPEEVELLEKAANCVRDRLLIRVLFRLGCRISEALALTVQDIDLQRGTVTIQHLKTSLRLACPQWPRRPPRPDAASRWRRQP